MERHEKLKVAKANIALKIADLVEESYGRGEAALVVPGTFTALLEAYRAIEIAETVDTTVELAQDAEDYRQGVLRNQE